MPNDRMQDSTKGMSYGSASRLHSHDYLMPTVLRVLAGLGSPGRLLDIGCGNGSKTAAYASQGWQTVGIDVSESGIQQARQAYGGTFEIGSAYDDHLERFGTFGAVVSLEVVEHLYDPPTFARRIFGCLDLGGTAILSTPYHGYAKNLALALSGELDFHFRVLRVGGHIKFWSLKTFRTLLSQAGFDPIVFHRVGRIPMFAKSMIAVARKPT